MAQEAKKFRHGKLYDLNISELMLDTTQPRKYFNEQALAELRTSIEKHGVLQPVLVRSAENGRFVVVSGERRYQASLQAGLSTIPALLTDGDPVEISIVENLLREDLTAIEEAEAIERLRASHDYHLKDLSNILGKAESTLCEILSLNRLPEEVKNDCRNNPKASRALLVRIAKQHGAEKMNVLYQKYKESTLSGPETRPRLARHASHELPLDLSFLGRCTRRIDSLDLASLHEGQPEELREELKRLRSAAFKKLKTLRSVPREGETSMPLFCHGAGGRKGSS